MLEEGTLAPSFAAEAHDGGKISLDDLQGRYVVLWFYPAADTPG